MTVVSWLAAAANRLVLRSRLRNDFLLSPAELEHAITCERSRVDRNGSVLSVLRTARPLNKLTQLHFDLLSEQLQLRLRITDSVGMNPAGQLLVLLPDTPIAGAARVAEDLQQMLRTSVGEVNFDIAVYPDDLHSDETSYRQQQSHSWPKPSGLHQPIGNSATASHFHRRAADQMFAWNCPPWKRAVDVVGASLGLVVASPLIALAAVAVRLNSTGGAFFSQKREGFGGRTFTIYKLRTMVQDAEGLKHALRIHSEQDGPAFKMSEDPRVTSLGRMLRKTSIDELPQLWNVIRGDMSLVGPRPLPVDESQKCVPWQRRRLSVRPGLTCIWQIRGRNTVTFDEWIRMDLRYINRRCLWYDLYLIITTAPAVLIRKGGR